MGQQNASHSWGKATKGHLPSCFYEVSRPEIGLQKKGQNGEKM